MTKLIIDTLFSKIGFTAFIGGMSIMIIEILGARLLVPLYGNTFYVWTSIIGVIMGALSLGYYRGGALADKNCNIDDLSKLLLYASISTAAIPILILLSSVFASLGMLWGPLFSTTLALAIPSYFLAHVSPYCIRLSTEHVDKAGITSGKIYAVGTMGSIVGTFIAGFLLIPYFKTSNTIFFLGLMLFIMSFLLNKKKSLEVLPNLMIIAIVIGVQAFFSPSISQITIPVDAKILHDEDSQYNSISVFETEINGSDGVATSRVLKLGRLIQGGYTVKEGKVSSYYEYPYLLHLAWAIKPEIKDILVLGHGAGVGVESIHKAHPEADIDVVDIDPKVFEVSSRFFNISEGEKLHFHVQDARIFLKDTDKKYDIIIMDVVGSTQQAPFDLVTLEMMLEAKDKLKKDGIYIQNIVSTRKGPQSILLKSIVKTLDEVFSRTYVIPVEDEEEKHNTVILMSTEESRHKEATSDFGGLDSGSREYILKKMERFIIDDYKLETNDAYILTDDFSPTESWV